jgi:hypothetical protein
VGTDTFQVFEGLDGPDTAGGHTDEGHRFTRQHRGKPEILNDELGHCTKAAMIFRGRKDDARCRGNRRPKPLPIPWVWLARERQRQCTGIEHERIDMALP